MINNMEGKEPDSRYLVLWICVIIAAGIILVGWFMAMKYNFNKMNEEMHNSVGQDFQAAEAEVFATFSEIEDKIREETQDISITPEQQEAIEEIDNKVDNKLKEMTQEEEGEEIKN